MIENFGQKICSLLPYFVIYLFSFIKPAVEIECCFLGQHVVMEKWSDWSIISGWFTGIVARVLSANYRVILKKFVCFQKFLSVNQRCPLFRVFVNWRFDRVF